MRGNTVITVINSFTCYQQCVLIAEDIKKHKTALIAEAKVYLFPSFFLVIAGLPGLVLLLGIPRLPLIITFLSPGPFPGQSLTN